MAGDWIKMRMDLRDDPAVVQIATDTKLDTFGVIGRLHAVWEWANRHTETGIVTGIQATYIDYLASRKGFAEAMSRAGWLEISQSGVSFPKFTRHNGDSAKKRATNAVAKKVSRIRHKNVIESNDKAVTREEKRREETEKNQFPPTHPEARTPSAAGGGTGGGGFQTHPSVRFGNARRPESNTVARIVGEYPRKGGGQAATDAAFHAIDRIARGTDLAWPDDRPRPPTTQDAAAWLLGRVRAYAASADAKRDDGKYVLGLARWMQEARFLDPDEAWGAAEPKGPTPEEVDANNRRIIEEAIARGDAEREQLRNLRLSQARQRTIS